MKSFLAKLVFHIQIKNKATAAEFDLQLRLIKAKSQAEALEQAKLLGEAEQDTFLNQTGKLVSWQFVGITELVCLDELSPGQSVCTQTHETEDAAKYLSLVKSRMLELESILLVEA